MSYRVTNLGEGSGNTAPDTRSKMTLCRKKFLRFFPDGFKDAKYFAWERGYKVKAHEDWQQMLNEPEFSALLRKQSFTEIATRAVRIEARTNLLFSFEKMALRDAVRSRAGAERFAKGLFQLLHGKGSLEARFSGWLDVVKGLPRKQTRVFTWPVVTVFGFLARPDIHIFLKPMVTKKAAGSFGFEFLYQSIPAWSTYENLLGFGESIRKNLHDLTPKDQIDVQSFIWVLGSDEYAD
ncbi:MAG TPA: hypothetical protein VG347_13240 [Verrucomicrobiae bacterium]|nr:hypothetical protein [Verrucomicrobiae bacterium]